METNTETELVQPNPYQRMILAGISNLRKPYYQGPADEVEEARLEKRKAKARRARKGLKGRPFEKKAQRQWNKMTFADLHQVNRAKKNQAIQEALDNKKEEVAS